MTLKPYYQDKYRTIYHGDCRGVVGQLSGVTAVVTDPPYELGFMGKSWDSKGISFQPLTWQMIKGSCLPGSPILAFGGTRTQHRIACAVEDAGWEIRDVLMWVYGSGFPKSMDISKATKCDQWNGYGTALKPAYEPIILAMNPLNGFAKNALEYGVAGLNIDGCRVPTEGADKEKHLAEWNRNQSIAAQEGRNSMNGGLMAIDLRGFAKEGRFPANFLHDGSQEVMELFPETGGGGKPQLRSRHKSTINFVESRPEYEPYNDTRNGGGSAARFFKSCPQDICYLCRLIIQLKHDIMKLEEVSCEIMKKLNRLALSVEKYFLSTRVTIENTVQENAMQNLKELRDQDVRFVENLCGSCGTRIALVLAEIKTLDFNQEELQVIQGCTGNSKSYILIQSLVQSVEKMESIDITPIIQDLWKSYGCVSHATTNYTQETEKIGRFKYTPKASKRERGEGNSHPTVKPLALMEYLCKLVKMPERNLILDPFCGSGSTLLACGNLGIQSIGIEADEASCEIAAKRCTEATIRMIKEGVY